MVGDSSPDWQLPHRRPSEALGMDSPVTKTDMQRHYVEFQHILLFESLFQSE